MCQIDNRELNIGHLYNIANETEDGFDAVVELIKSKDVLDKRASIKKARKCH